MYKLFISYLVIAIVIFFLKKKRIDGEMMCNTYLILRKSLPVA